MTVKLTRVDTGFIDGAPALRAWDDDRTEYTYRLSPSETAALVKHFAGYLGAYFASDWNRSTESWKANPHIYNTQDVG